MLGAGADLVLVQLEVVGRTGFQGPEVDGTTTLRGADARVGDLVAALVVESDGVDLVASPR